MNFSLLVLPILLISTIIIDKAAADCCSGTYPFGGVAFCKDGTTIIRAEGDFCCGKGKCNMFCCNCDGGCRGSKLASNGENTLITDGFQSLDINKDSVVSLDEAKDLVTSGRVQNPALTSSTVEAEFNKLDLDKDGVLSRLEIDPVSATTN